MKEPEQRDKLLEKRFYILIIAIVLISAGVFVYAFLRITALENRLSGVSSDLASSTATLLDTAQKLAVLQSDTSGLSQTLQNTQQDIAMVSSNVSDVKNQVGGVQQTLGSVTGSVSTLQKLVTTDPELLKKYSKIYFLNENYSPTHQSNVPQDYVYSNSQPEQYLDEAMPFLIKMLAAAKQEGIALYVRSGYRSFAEQQTLKNEYTVIYGAGTANSFAADQGYSEHQLGTTVDVITGGLGGELTDAFDATIAYKWLVANAYKYGFELSYPKGNAYYVYEPWHWRFVGVKLATYLHNNNKNFYDMDQRVIDGYLAELFDQ